MAKQWQSALASVVTALDAETGLSPGSDSERVRSACARVEEARSSLPSLLNDVDEKG